MARSILRVSGSFIAVIVTLGLAVACSGSSKGSGFASSSGGSSSGGSSSGGSSSGGSSSGGSSSGGLGDVTDGGDIGDAACATSSVTAEQKPLDMYIMLDQSGSMREKVGNGDTKWSAITAALTAFVQQPSVAGIGVGIQYFGLGASLFNPADSCTAADYAKPEIEIAALPGNASAIVTSMGQHGPTTSTPTSPALQGAVDHAKEWQTAHADHVTVAVLATDGNPEECDTDLNNIDAIAAAAKSGTPSILTFVIGVGSSLTNLNGIAAAGGTTQAFIVDTNGNANQQFLDALNKIRGTALGCQYKIPLPTSGGKIDYGAVNVEYTPGGGSTQTLPKVDDKSKCPANGGAWYYDNNASPTEIILCDTTCSTVSGDAKASLNIVLGCKTVVK